MSGFDFDMGSDSPQDMSSYFVSDSPPFAAQSSSASQSPVPPPAFRKSKWTADEDDALRQSVGLHGLGNWSLISHDLPGRNGKQCRERWMNQLCPALNKDNWTPQEDAILLQYQRVYGNLWSRIAQFLPGRSPNATKNRWSWLSRHTLTSALATRMIPSIHFAPAPPPRPVILPKLTAPPELQWGGAPFGPPAPRGAFSEPADLGCPWESLPGDGDAEAPERLAADGDDLLRLLEGWSF
jgi:hypothetical protein